MPVSSGGQWFLDRNCLLSEGRLHTALTRATHVGLRQRWSTLPRRAAYFQQPHTGNLIAALKLMLNQMQVPVCQVQVPQPVVPREGDFQYRLDHAQGEQSPSISRIHASRRNAC